MTADKRCSIAVLARRYFGGSMYCRASTPGFEHVVAIPVGSTLPDEFKKELWPNSPEGERYFVFSGGMNSLGVRYVMSTYDPPVEHAMSWNLCRLELRENGGLRFTS